MNRPWSLRRLMACFLLLIALLSIAACMPTHRTLQVFYTNDVHGYAAEERDEEGGLVRVGYPRLKAYVDRLKPLADENLLLDAGDSLHGQPLATARRGEFIARLLSLMDYDAMALGNHEFDYGLDRLLELSKKYDLPFVAANVLYKDSGLPVFKPYIIRKSWGLKVGILGVSTPETPRSTNPANVADLIFLSGEELAARINEIVQYLRTEEKVDIVIALTHLGTEPFIEYNAQWLAQNVDMDAIDYIFDGHSHSEVKELIINGAIISSTGAFFHNVGESWINFDSYYPRTGRILSNSYLEAANSFLYMPQPNPADPGYRKIVAELEKIEKELAKEMAVVVGRAPFDLEGRREIVRHESSNLGRLITAAMMQYTGADAALFNSGSIRASIPAGEITRGKLLEVLPYGNYTVTVKLSGAELRTVMAQGLRSGGSGGFLQFSGLRVKAERLPGKTAGYTIRSIEIGGQPLSDQAEYVIAINDFMNAGGDAYELLKKHPIGEYETVEEMLLKYIGETPADELSRVSRSENLISR